MLGKIYSQGERVVDVGSGVKVDVGGIFGAVGVLVGVGLGVILVGRGVVVEVAVPLAAATLAALLQHLCAQAQGNEKIPNKAMSKILPVVPVHA